MMSFGIENQQNMEQPFGKCLPCKRLLIGALATMLGSFFSACSFSTNNNQPVGSTVPLPISMKPATSPQKQALIDYAVQAKMALDLVKQSSTEVAEVISDVGAYAAPTTPLSPTTEYAKVLALANKNCLIRKVDETPTNDRLRNSKKSSRWSDNESFDQSPCGYKYTDITETTGSKVPDQGTLSTSGKSLHLDLTGVKEKLSQNDVLEIGYAIGTKTYDLALSPQSEPKKNHRYMTQSSKSASSTLTLVNGIRVQFDLSETLITEKIFVDDNLSRVVGSRTLTFLARLPVGDIGYEKKIKFLESGKTSTRIELNGEVISEK